MVNNIENYLSRLEDIIECKIHLGSMINPKILSCHHSFCYKCLKEYSKFRTNLICPVCRNIEPANNVGNLPSAIVENKLIDIINEIRSTNHSNETTINDERINLNNDEIMNSELNIEIIEENMRNESHYRHVYENERQYFNQQISERVYFSNFAVNISDSRLKQIIYVDSYTNQLTVYSAINIQRFFIILNDTIVIPEYIRIIGKNLVLTAKFKTDNKMWSVFLLCDLQGQIINQSNLHCNFNESGLPLMLGFDFNETDQKYYLCMPENKTISFYDSFLVENDVCYDLNDNSPEYVAFHSSEKQLFVSCPLNKRILILNIENGSFKTISTEQIDPKMIFLTNDEKILFLDTKENRIIWIKIIDEHLFKQQLDIGPLNNELEIKSFIVLPFSTIFISSGNKISTFQLEKYLSSSTFRFCNLL